MSDTQMHEVIERDWDQLSLKFAFVGTVGAMLAMLLIGCSARPLSRRRLPLDRGLSSAAESRRWRALRGR